MNIITKVILTSKEEIKDKLVERLELNKTHEQEWFEIFSGEKDWEQKTLAFYKVWSEQKVVKYLSENYEIIKIVYVWFANILSDLELKFWDIILPNAFINEENNWVFVDYAVWENYDLNKFWLLMNWICLTIKSLEKYAWETQEILEKYSPDVIDDESFYILEELKNKDLMDKSVWIKLIISDSKEENIEILENLINITELVL